MDGLFRAWGKILRGNLPVLSIEITRECPLTCAGCYAYASDHLGDAVNLRQLSDYSGDKLVRRFFALIDQYRPLHVSIVGGEPLVRYRELAKILPRLATRGIHTQVVTSAVRPIPLEWASLPNLDLSVSIDGLQPEHDARRKPATYDRPYPQTHCRVAGDGPLHGHTSASQTGRLSGGVRHLLVGPGLGAKDSRELVHSSDRRSL